MGVRNEEREFMCTCWYYIKVDVVYFSSTRRHWYAYVDWLTMAIKEQNIHL